MPKSGIDSTSEEPIWVDRATASKRARKSLDPLPAGNARRAESGPRERLLSRKVSAGPPHFPDLQTTTAVLQHPFEEPT